MITLIIILFVLIFIVFPILWAIAEEDRERSNKKIQDFYKEMEEKRKTEYAAMYTIEEIEDTDND